MPMQSFEDQKANVSKDKLSARVHKQYLDVGVYAQICDDADDFKEGMGENATFTKVLRLEKKGRELDPNKDIEASNLKFATGTCKVKEYGNRVDVPKLMKVLSQHDIPKKAEEALQDDYGDTMEELIEQVCETAKFQALITSTTATTVVQTGTPGATTRKSPTLKTIRALIDYMEKWKVPLRGSYFFGFGATDFISAIYEDLEAIAKYLEPEYRLHNEVGQVYGTRFMKDRNYLENDVEGDASNVGEGIIVGKEAVVEAVAEEFKAHVDVDGVGKRLQKLSWTRICGYEKMWDIVADEKRVATAPGYKKGLERIMFINKKAA
jgi:N4-gp56 family major capsid protein